LYIIYKQIGTFLRGVFTNESIFLLQLFGGSTIHENNFNSL
jgi:hypothetical protein